MTTKVQSSWFKQLDANKDVLSLWCSKVSSNVCLCKWCKSHIRVKSKGIRALNKHSVCEKHRNSREVALGIKEDMSETEDDKKNGKPEIVYIQAQDSNASSDSDSESSDEESSEDFTPPSPKKRKRKSRDSGSDVKRSIRRLQDQLDLFQRNVDIKLNYIESLIQTVVKNQSQHSQQGTSAVRSASVTPSINISKPSNKPSMRNQRPKPAEFNRSSPKLSLIERERERVCSNLNEQRTLKEEIVSLHKEVRSFIAQRNDVTESSNSTKNSQLSFEMLEKVDNNGDLLDNEKKLMSNTQENIDFRCNLVSRIIPYLNNKLGYTKIENSLVASGLTTYFADDFLSGELSWSSKRGRASLSDKPGHIRMFFITINEAFPGTFRTVTELSRCIPLVLKRIREKRRRTDSKVLRVDDRDDKKCIEPLTFIDDKEESSGNWDSEDELLIEMK